MLKLVPAHDRREFGRRKADVTAWINLRGQPPRRCTVLNVSEGGALIEAGDTEPLPRRFSLTLESGLKLACEVRHRRGTTVGVEFAVAEAPRGVVSSADTVIPKPGAAPQFRDMNR